MSFGAYPVPAGWRFHLTSLLRSVTISNAFKNRTSFDSGAGNRFDCRRIGKRGENPPRPRHCDRREIASNKPLSWFDWDGKADTVEITLRGYSSEVRRPAWIEFHTEAFAGRLWSSDLVS